MGCCILNYLHSPIKRGIILAKAIIPLCSTITRGVTLQTKRVLNTQGGASSLSSLSPLSSKHELFFPCSGKLGDDYPLTFPGFEDKPHYDHEHNNEPILIKKGQHFDVISLLSTHADDLFRIGSNNLVKATNDLRGKYIMLCCGFVPSLWKGGSCNWWNLSLLSSELSQPHIRIREYLEIVIVPKMRQKWDKDEGAFEHFLSAFRGCLSVPFTQKHGRDHICKSLNFEGKPICIVVDPSQKVLQVDFEKSVKYGAGGFPFTDEHLVYLDAEEGKRTTTTNGWSPILSSLAALLGWKSDPSLFLLRKLDSEETCSIEQLNKHHVGLYMFREGDLLYEVNNIYLECRDKGLDLEIVLVCLQQGMDYQDAVNFFSPRENHVLVYSNWWVFPYNDTDSPRIKKLCYISHLCGSPTDSLFIVGPNNKFVERLAAQVLFHFRPHLGLHAYPFTMEALFRAFLQRLDRVTLDSFLTHDYVYRDYECDDTKIMHVSELKGKNVIVYVGHFYCEWFDDVVYWYNVIKEVDSDFELVYVPMVDPSNSEYAKFASRFREHIFKSKTKWLICPFEDPQQWEFLKNHDAFLFLQGPESEEKGLPTPAVLAFGKDGRLHSFQAISLFENYKFDDVYPFLVESRIQNLCEELRLELVLEYNFIDLHEPELMNGFDFLQNIKKNKTKT